MVRNFFGKKGVVVSGMILFFFFCTIVLSLESQTNDDKNLREEILTVFKDKGEKGLRKFIKNRLSRISKEFILDLTESGIKERKEEWLNISKILAEEQKDEKTLADVYLKMGKFFRLISAYKHAFDFFERALLIYVKLNDIVGQGNACFGEGEVCYYTGENNKALEFLDKAMQFFEKSGDLNGKASVYWRKGDTYFIIGDNVKALEMYNKALISFKKSLDSIGQGNVLKSLGSFYYYTGDISKASLMYDKALPYFEKLADLRGQGNVSLGKGDVSLRNGNTEEAIEMYDKALDFYKRAKDYLGQGNVYQSKGDLYLRSGDISKSLSMYDKALPFFKESGILIGVANLYRRKGAIYFYIGENSKAIDMYDKAFPIYEKIKEPTGLGNVYMGKGDIYSKIGDNSNALEMFEKALLIYENAGDIIGVGNIYKNKGAIFSRTGNFLNALKMYNKSLLYFEKGGSLTSQGYAYFAKGNIFFSSGDISRAEKMYLKALDIFKKVGDPVGQGNGYYCIGKINFCIGDISKAFEMFQKASTLYKRSGTSLGQAIACTFMGDILLKKVETSKASKMYESALTFYKESGDVVGIGDIYKRQGDILLDMNENKKAIETYEKALQIFTKIRHIEGESYILHGKAKAFVKLQKKEKALSLFMKGIDNLEKVRNKAGLSDMKRTFMESTYEQYEEVAEFLLGNQYYEKGFKYAEMMKARVFLDQLAEGMVRLDKGITHDLKQQRDTLISKLSNISKEIAKAAAENQEKKLKELKEKYRQVEEEFKELLIKIRVENPLYSSVRYPQPVSLKDLQENVLKKKELILRYFLTKEKVYVFLISKNNFTVTTLEVNTKTIKEMVEQYLLAVKLKNSADVTKYGRFLYMRIFKPLEKWLKGRKSLIIVPDGDLVKIPFESFVLNFNKSGEPIYLVEKYRIKYVQSATVLTILRKHYHRKGTTKYFIGFGDPVYDYEKFKNEKSEISTVNCPQQEEDEIKEISRSRYFEEGGLLKRLKASGEEIHTIAGFFKKKAQKSVINLRDKANEANAKSPSLKEFDFIHFSCHGILGEGLQSLVLSQLPESPEDGFLTLNEIMNCKYNAKLVVLSACQTGKGKMAKGEGVIGLTRAIMYAGTPAVVASLWKVDDVATKELMVRFYENILNKKMDKEEALRKAKLKLIKSKNYSSPFFWGSFIMYGE